MNRDNRESGAALIWAMAVGLIVTMTMVALADAMVVEYRATEDSLMEVRAYWASWGQAAYVLSRTAQSGACNGKTCPAPTGGKDPGAYLTSAQAYLKEITSAPETLQTWLYPDVSADYLFKLTATVCADQLAPSNTSGEMLLISAVSGSTPCPPAPPANDVPTPTKCAAPAAPAKKSLPALRAINTVRPVEIRYCLVAIGATTCGAGPGATSSGAQLITSVHRPSC